jgi:hypothetical protein
MLELWFRRAALASPPHQTPTRRSRRSRPLSTEMRGRLDRDMPVLRADHCHPLTCIRVAGPVPCSAYELYFLFTAL